MIKGFFEYEIFDFGIFLGRKILASTLLSSLILEGIFLGIPNNLKIRDSSCVSWPHSSSGNFYGSEIQHGIFGGVEFWPRDFFGVLISASIQSSLSLEI